MRHLALSVLLVSAACAADNVRLDLKTRDGTALESFAVTAGKGRLALAGWGPEAERKGYLSSFFAIPAGTWTEVGFTFTPAADCEATINLMGPWKPRPGSDGKELEQVFVTWDKVVIAGASIANGDFEELDAKGLPKDWSKGGGAAGSNKLVTTGAKSGSNAVLAWHNGTFSQVIRLPGGKPVTLTVWARSDVDPAAP